VKAGDILDRIIRANYIFLFWLTVFALVGFVGFTCASFARWAGIRDSSRFDPDFFKMKTRFIFILLPIMLAGCVSKPTAKVETVTPEAPLAVGDCLVLEVKDRGSVPPWRRTIDAEGYFSAPLGQRVKIAGKTLTEAKDLLASKYVESMLGPPRLVLIRCEEYDRMKMGSK
jgi:hypothetical protein